MNKETQFLQNLSHATMTRDEKTRQRTALMAYADNNPVVVAKSAPTFFSILASSTRFPLYASLMSIIVIGGGASTLAAEGSVPGDTFYSIKIHVNEPLMSALSPSTEGQARVSAELAARRVDEVVILASTGRLTEANQQYLDTQFSKEIEKTIIHANNLSKGGNEESADAVKIGLASSLASEAQALGAVRTPVPEQTKTFLRKVLALSDTDTEDVSDTGQTATVQSQTPHNTLSFNKKHPGVPAAFIGTTSQKTATTSRPRDSLKVREGYRTATLRLTASTTLQSLFESNQGLMAPKTDRAIEVKQETEVNKSSTGLHIDL